MPGSDGGVALQAGDTIAVRKPSDLNGAEPGETWGFVTRVTPTAETPISVTELKTAPSSSDDYILSGVAPARASRATTTPGETTDSRMWARGGDARLLLKASHGCLGGDARRPRSGRIEPKSTS